MFMIFGRKGKDASLEEKLKEIEEKIKGLKEKESVSLPQSASVPQHTEEKPKESEEETQTPLFVKLDKYKSIVSSLIQLKTLLISLRNSLTSLEQIEKARMEAFNAIIKNLDKISERLSILEKEIVKPIGNLGLPILSYPSYEELRNVEATIANLKAQIEQLKTQLDSLE
jgi:DNA repair exonuclease SbcCD ATPase subunit